MIKFVGIYYQPKKGEKFDEKYYREKHLPMVKKLLPGIVQATYAKCQPGAEGEDPVVVGIGAVAWRDMESFKRDMELPEIKKVMDDVPNYATGKVEVLTVVEEEI